MRHARQGFTLIEVVITLLIVSMTLLLAVQGLTNSMAQAGHTRSLKVARELALFTLGQLESGLYTEDIEDHMQGDYADQDYADFNWELVLGDEDFYDPEEILNGAFDSWNQDNSEDDESKSTDPWVVARVKVSFPPTSDRPAEVIIERWITREFVYGEEEKKGADR